MKWDNVQITDNNNKVYTGKGASEFVENHCQPIQIRTTEDGLIEVYAGIPGSTQKDKEVRKYLFARLVDKAKSLKITTGDEAQRVMLPLARAVKNVFNLIPTKLKVEFIYNRDPKGSESRTYLEDSKVTVTALLEGSNAPLTMTADKGIADFGLVAPGDYTITADYPESDECKYDWIDKTRRVLVKPTSIEIVEFQVEPLYQKVEFIAHCLLTIPDQIFVLDDEDKGKAEIIDNNGKKSFVFKSREVEEIGPDWSMNDLNIALENKAACKFNMFAKPPRTITLNKKIGDEYWKLEDIQGIIEDKITIGSRIGVNEPEKYPITKFKQRLITNMEAYVLNDLTSRWKAKYHGFLDDTADIEARVKFVEDTLEKAYAKSNHEATVLKVFMIPECFFQGLYGVYIADDAAELVGKLQNLVKDKKWKDWVFSFGTVNRVFLGLQPKSVTGGEKNKTIYEMANHAPVIRGGLEKFDFSGDDSTRLIQKLTNSAELADESDLIRDPKITELLRKKEEMFKQTEEKVKIGELEKNELENEIKKIDGIEIKRIRPQAVNEEVQFEATEYDEMVARLLEKLFGDNTINSAGLRGGENEIKAEIKKSGIARVVRQIRTSKENGIFSVWRERLKLYEAKLDAAQELEWKERLEAAEKMKDEEKFKEQKKIEEEKKSKNPVPLKDLQQASMSLEDYVFACPRKAGPLFKTLEDAEKAKPCKRLVFGLEICADHGQGRISTINKEANLIDIHLVPSAGMKPKYFAARKGGLLFNCDGWNQRLKEEGDFEQERDIIAREKAGTPKDEGGRNIETHFDGPSPYAKLTKMVEKLITPVYPHSVVAKRETDDTSIKSSLKPVTILTPDADLSKVIFGCGAGEIHFYPLQDLPK